MSDVDLGAQQHDSAAPGLIARARALQCARVEDLWTDAESDASPEVESAAPATRLPVFSGPADEARLTATLRSIFGFETLRPLQDEAIRATLAGRDALVVLPTGDRKSVV